MHPILILLPAAVLVFGPRLWVKRVLVRHDSPQDSLPCTGGELARQLLDQHDLQTVKVEITDIGDHYDPEARSVRLARERFERRSLTALATAAHEVGHALQHAHGYGPFVLRANLAKMSRVTGEVGSALLLAVPLAAIASRRPVPPAMIAATALSILGVGAAAQLTAVPTELDASFERALPMLRNGYVDAAQLRDVHEILTACSLTYVASSLLGVLHIWPWLGKRPFYADARPLGALSGAWAPVTKPQCRSSNVEIRGRLVPGERTDPQVSKALFRRIARPLIRAWVRIHYRPHTQLR